MIEKAGEGEGGRVGGGMTLELTQLSEVGIWSSGFTPNLSSLCSHAAVALRWVTRDLTWQRTGSIMDSTANTAI